MVPASSAASQGMSLRKLTDSFHHTTPFNNFRVSRAIPRISPRNSASSLELLKMGQDFRLTTCGVPSRRTDLLTASTDFGRLASVQMVVSYKELGTLRQALDKNFWDPFQNPLTKRVIPRKNFERVPRGRCHADAPLGYRPLGVSIAQSQLPGHRGGSRRVWRVFTSAMCALLPFVVFWSCRSSGGRSPKYLPVSLGGPPVPVDGCAHLHRAYTPTYN